MIGYVTLGTNDVAVARKFYDGLFGCIGAKRVMEFGDFTMWSVSPSTPGVALTPPYDKRAATAGNGNMVAIVLDTRAKVDAFYAKAIELGGSDEGAPGLRGDEGPQAFYAGYFRDPEGNKLCAFRTGPA